MLYHASDYLTDERVTLTPRIPSDRANGEDATIPRISVALTVDGCIAGIHGCSAKEYDPDYHVDAEYPDRFSVYRALNPGLLLDPLNLVPDAGRSGELWLVAPTDFILVGRIVAWMERPGRYLWRWLTPDE